MAYERKTPKPMTPPAKITTAEERGLALRVWLNRQGIKIADFAESAGIGRATLHRYLVGTKDLETIETGLAHKLLSAMGISDSDAWDVLGISEEARETFRSFRAWPLGGTLDDADGDYLLAELIDTPLLGSVSVPTGTTIKVARDISSLPHLVYQLEDGRLFSAPSEMREQVEGRLLGALHSVYFADVE